MKTIFLISGKKRSGKDYVGELLVQKLNQYGKSAKVLHFADKIKEILMETFKCDKVFLENIKLNGTLKVDIPQKICDVLNYNVYNTNSYLICSGRELLQRFGTDAMQKVFGKTVWRDLVMKEIEESSFEYFVIPDFRFKHEYIDKYNVITIKVSSDDVISDDHISENDLNDFKFNYYIHNNKLSDDEITKELEKICLTLF